MSSIKTRLERLEANAPASPEDRVTEIHRVMVGRTNPDGSPIVKVRYITR